MESTRNCLTFDKCISVAEQISKMHHVLEIRAVTPETIDKVVTCVFQQKVKMREIVEVSRDHEQLSEFISFYHVILKNRFFRELILFIPFQTILLSETFFPNLYIF